ncbi:MAG: ATP-binding protein [Nitrosomonadales bacterium]|nr:ATP-binding protein [Nitrosomonadales bacterium]
MNSSAIYPRFALSKLQDALADTPAVLIHGARQCGKTTLAQMAGGNYAYFSFDDENILATAKRDPVGFVDRLPQHVVLDEVQRAPELFASLKHAIDQDRKPGRFMLTGSANLMLLPQLSDSLAGRIEVLQLYPLAQSELAGQQATFLQQMFGAEMLAISTSKRLGDELIERIVNGGFPEPLRRTTESRRRAWYRNYIDTLVQRDIRDIARISNLEAIPKLLQMIANHSGQLINVSELAKAFQLSRLTVDHYVALLRQIFLVEFLQPWFSNQNKRLIKTPKVHLMDTGLATAVLKLNVRQLQHDHNMLGHLLESFVYAELRKQASWLDADMAFYHYRDKDQYEVDIVMENGDGRLLGIEVKAAATVVNKDFNGLRRLQRVAGERFHRGILLYDGQHILPFGDGLYAVPVSRLWEV